MPVSRFQIQPPAPEPVPGDSLIKQVEGVINTLADNIYEQDIRIDAVEQTANAALATANDALDTAQSAMDTANDAAAAAQTAQQTADTAIADAAAARNTANQALNQAATAETLALADVNDITFTVDSSVNAVVANVTQGNGNRSTRNIPPASAPSFDPDPNYLGSYADAAALNALPIVTVENPDYLGLYANETAINAITNMVAGNFADCAYTGTEWTYNGTAWADSANPIGTTSHTVTGNYGPTPSAGNFADNLDTQTEWNFTTVWADSGNPIGTTPHGTNTPGNDGMMPRGAFAQIEQNTADVQTALDKADTAIQDISGKQDKLKASNGTSDLSGATPMYSKVEVDALVGSSSGSGTIGVFAYARTATATAFPTDASVHTGAKAFDSQINTAYTYNGTAWVAAGTITPVEGNRIDILRWLDGTSATGVGMLGLDGYAIYDAGAWVFYCDATGGTVAFGSTIKTNIDGSKDVADVATANPITPDTNPFAANQSIEFATWEQQVVGKVNALFNADGSNVKTTGNQTVAGTKTFTTSPVVPSKTAAATNTGTAIATEAQVALKANLSSPAFTDVPTAPTAATAIQSGQLATTSFVQAVAASGYGTCATAAATVAKVVTLSGFLVSPGRIGAVRFTYANTAANPTLNINSNGAKPIFYQGTRVTGAGMLGAGIHIFIYNGSQWDLLNPVASASATKLPNMTDLVDVTMTLVTTGNSDTSGYFYTMPEDGWFGIHATGDGASVEVNGKLNHPVTGSTRPPGSGDDFIGYFPARKDDVLRYTEGVVRVSFFVPLA